MLLDANLLLFAVHEASPFHVPARDWLSEQLSGSRRVGLPWQTMGAFLRIGTATRAFESPLDPNDAWKRISEWLGCRVVWIPTPGPRHAEILGDLILRHQIRGDLVTDAQLAALAIEHGLTIYSADTDFARFTEARWENPLAPSAKGR